MGGLRISDSLLGFDDWRRIEHLVCTFFIFSWFVAVFSNGLGLWFSPKLRCVVPRSLLLTQLVLFLTLNAIDVRIVKIF